MQKKKGHSDPIGSNIVQDLSARPKPVDSMPVVAQVMTDEYSQPLTFNPNKEPPKNPGDIIPNEKHKTQKYKIL